MNFNDENERFFKQGMPLVISVAAIVYAAIFYYGTPFVRTIFGVTGGLTILIIGLMVLKSLKKNG